MILLLHHASGARGSGVAVIIDAMRLFWVLLATVVGGLIGWRVGESRLPPAAELETAVYPIGGAVIGASLALVVAIVVLILLRRTRN